MLTDTQVRKLKAGEKPAKLTDSGGLYLYLTTAGGKYWRWKYRFNGKEKLLSLGEYPDVPLTAARAARDEAKVVLKGGKDPALVRKLARLSVRRDQADTFETVAREWHELQKPLWVERHAADVLDSLENEVFPHLGDQPVRDLTAANVLPVLRLIEARGARETARRVRQRMSAVFVYAISSGRATLDPAATVQNAMAPLIKGRQPAVTDIDAARAMLRAVETTPAHPVTKLAIRLLALTVARPGPFSATTWAELDDIDDTDPVWTIPAARMKLKKKFKDDENRDHLIPLSTQAVETIEALRQLTGGGRYVFPNARGAHKPMSENAMGYLLNRAGYYQRHVPHGFRSTFSTVMNERFTADRAIIDFMLAHVPKDEVEAAYNRSLYLERRRELAQEWADIILKDAPPAASLIEGPRRKARPGA